MQDLIPLLQTGADSAMLALIWLVQLIIYPAFRHIRPDRFPAWHRIYVRTISVIVIPLMLIQACCIAVQLMGAPKPEQLGAAGAVLSAWVVTFTISAPCHRKLQAVGSDEALIQHLINTNWLRTIGWTLAWILNLQAYLTGG